MRPNVLARIENPYPRDLPRPLPNDVIRAQQQWLQIAQGNCKEIPCAKVKAILYAIARGLDDPNATSYVSGSLDGACPDGMMAVSLRFTRGTCRVCCEPRRPETFEQSILRYANIFATEVQNLPVRDRRVIIGTIENRLTDANLGREVVQVETRGVQPATVQHVVQAAHQHKSPRTFTVLVLIMLCVLMILSMGRRTTSSVKISSAPPSLNRDTARMVGPFAEQRAQRKFAAYERDVKSGLTYPAMQEIGHLSVQGVQGPHQDLLCAGASVLGFCMCCQGHGCGGKAAASHLC